MKRINYSISLLDTLHIGSGLAHSGYPRTAAIQKRAGRPFIPSSTLRGKIRANLRSLLPAFRKTASPDTLSVISNHKDNRIISDLFGAPNHTGRVVVMDGVVDSDIQIDRVPGIRLEDRTRSVASHALFSYEVVPAGVSFSSSLFLSPSPQPEANSGNIDELLLLLSLKHIERTGIGRQASRVAIDLGPHEQSLDQLMKELIIHE